jgi:hypothetical protein
VTDHVVSLQTVKNQLSFWRNLCKRKSSPWPSLACSSAAFAQTNVTIQGLFDTGYQNFKSETAGAVTTKTNRVGVRFRIPPPPTSPSL